ncbi:kelch-like protein 10 [Genypterus blacodes]|uniref:kelch-like protein 10 n=1 Tax=Genypterus blacodes TaxID=154954 RepID=UPI003F766A00
MTHGSSSVFNELRLQQELCDAVIRVQNKDFHVHRIILSGYSEYFRSLFTRWSHPADRVYQIDQVSPAIMRVIIEFAYMGSEEVNQQNVEELYIACDFFKVIGLMEACCRFMGEHLSKKNCIDIWQLTETFFCPTLNNDAFNLIVQHFTEVCASSEFLKLSVQQLLKLIETDQLLVRDERTVFEAILRWINHSPEERKTYISQILPKVRLALMTPDYFITNVRDNKMVRCNIECQDTVKTAETLLNDGIVSSLGIYHPLARPRLPSSILFAIGGWIKNDVALANIAIEAYDICTDRWVNVTNTEEARRSNHGAVFLNGSVYCVGGHYGVEPLSSVHRFDLATHTWHQVASMKTRRCCVSIATLNGRIYAIGGYDIQSRLSTADCYDPETNQWRSIAPMHDRRSQASCTTFQGKVYICGGYSGTEFLSSAENYCPETNQWTLIAPMSTSRCGLGVVAFEEQIYAVGGNSGGTRLDIAEVYNPQTDSWQLVTPMQIPRSNFGIEVVDGRLFVIGGFNGFSYISNVETYDINTGEWSEATSMGFSRSGLSCCVVSGLSNMADYAAPRDSSPDDFRAYPDLPVGTLLAIGGGSTSCPSGVTNGVETRSAFTVARTPMAPNQRRCAIQTTSRGSKLP